MMQLSALGLTSSLPRMIVSRMVHLFQDHKDDLSNNLSSSFLHSLNSDNLFLHFSSWISLDLVITMNSTSSEISLSKIPNRLWKDMEET
jgi:hypothetical protein